MSVAANAYDGHKQIDLGGFQFRKDLHIFSYQDGQQDDILVAFTKKDEVTNRQFIVLLRSESLKDFARSISLAVIEVPEGKEVTDMFLTPSGSLAVSSMTVSPGLQ